MQLILPEALKLLPLYALSLLKGPALRVRGGGAGRGGEEVTRGTPAAIPEHVIAQGPSAEGEGGQGEGRRSYLRVRARGRCEGGKEVPERYVQASLLLVWPSPYLTALLLAFTPHTQDGVRVDDRSLWVSQMMALPCARISPLLYPRLLPIFGALTGAEHMEQLPDGVVSVGRCGVFGVCGEIRAARMAEDSRMTTGTGVGGRLP